MKKIPFKKLATMLLVATVVGGGGWAGYWYYIHAQLQGKFFFDWEQTADSSVATLTVANTTFHIPKNYLLNRSSRKGGKVDGFTLTVLLPELEPYSEKNSDEFKKLGWNRKMRIGVDTRDTSPLTNGQYENNLRSGSYERDESNLATSLAMEFHTRRFKGIAQGELFGRRQNGSINLFLHCDPLESAPSPGCRGHFDLNNETTVSITFSRNYLEQIAGIEERVRRLLRDFQAAPSRK